MTALVPAQEWWSPAEIAAAALPDLPATRQGVDAQIERAGWRAQPGLSRRRSGKGGGWEYSWRLFPSRAQRKLLTAAAAPVAVERPTRDAQWTWFEGLPEAVKAKSRARLTVLQAVEALEPAVGRHMAVVSVATSSGVGARTIWSWIAMVEGVRADDRLAWLAPRNRAAEARRPRAKDCDPAFFDRLKVLYLRLGAPTFSDCYRDALALARAQGWDTLPERTMRRRMDRGVSAPVQVADNIVFGPELQVAKTLVDECLNEWAAGSRDEIRAIVTRAFNTDKEGQINRSEIFMLLRLDIADERWKRAMEAIRDAMRIVGSKTYVRAFRRASQDAAWEPITIDLAKA